MDAERFFPVVESRKTASGFESLAGIRLKSIMKGDLLFRDIEDEIRVSNPKNPLHPEVIQKARESLLSAISSWSNDVTVELHLTGLPDLTSRPRGCVNVHLFIRTTGESADRNNEQVLARYLCLIPLLATFFPYLEFEPVVTRRDLSRAFSPFKAWNAVSIERNIDSIDLSSLVERPLISGFGQLRGKVPATQLPRVIHRCPYVPSNDDGSKLLNLLMLQLDPCKIVFRFRPAKLDASHLEKNAEIITACETALAGNLADQITLNRQTALIRDVVLKQSKLLMDACLDVGVFIISPCPIDPALPNVVGRTITSCRNDENSDLFRGGFTVRGIDIKEAADASFFTEETPFPIAEASCAFRLPVPPLEDMPGLPVKRFRSIMARLPQRESVPKGSVEVFQNKHLGLTQPVIMTDDDRMRHMFIIGQTGTGKSALMTRMILQDIRSGKGLAVIDPHGDMVDDVISRMPVERKDDVILFDMLDRERPMGFNVLAWETEEDRDLVIDSLYQSLDAIYDMRSTGGPIFEKYFRGMLRLLMMDKHIAEFTPTLLEFNMCFVNAEFRSWLKKQSSDTVIYDFVHEIENACGDNIKLNSVAPYITSKLSRFISDKTLKMIVGQEKTSFDFSEVMNQGKILFIKLGKGRFGPTVSALLANQLVGRFKLAAMKRGDMPPETRKDFFLYVDESQNLPQENFTELLSEARKFRMGLVLSTQYSAQLGDRHNPNSLISGILGNVGTIVSFRLGQEDALQIGKIFQPCFSARDIRELPNFNGYAVMQQDNQSITPFNFVTRYDATTPDPGIARSIIDRSRELYGTHVRDVQTMIERRRTIWRRL